MIRKTIKIVSCFLLINILFDLAVGSGLAVLLAYFFSGTYNLNLYLIILNQLLKLGLLVVFLKYRGKAYREKYGKVYIKTRNLRPDSYKIFIIGLGVAGFGNILLSLFLKVFENNSYIRETLQNLEEILSYNTRFEYALLFISVVVLAPILEEILLRGILFSETKKYLGKKSAIVINGLAFAIYHMNLIQGINTFFMGMVLAYIYYYRKSIKEVILVHMLNNLMAMVMETNYYLALAMGIVCFFAIFLGLKFLLEFRLTKD